MIKMDENNEKEKEINDVVERLIKHLGLDEIPEKFLEYLLEEDGIDKNKENSLDWNELFKFT